MKKYKISVILVAYNSRELISSCLEALFRQTEPFELIVIDNGSSDGTHKVLDRLRQKKFFHLVYSPGNPGFGVAVNRIFSYLRCDYCVLINPDTVIQDVDFFKQARTILDKRPELAGIAPLLLRPDSNIIDSLGIVYHPFTLRPADLMSGRKVPESLFQEKEVLGCTGALAIYRQSSLQQIVQKDRYLFDENIFLYYEDVDLAFRLKKRGGKCLAIPNLTAYHHRLQSFRQNREIEAQAYYNRLYCLRKNLSLKDFLKGFPINILWEAVRFFKISFRNPTVFKRLFK